MELRKIVCDVKECGNSFEESFYNEGFPGWGHFFGLQEIVETKQGLKVNEKACLCPEHKAKVLKILNGEL